MAQGLRPGSCLRFRCDFLFATCRPQPGGVLRMISRRAVFSLAGAALFALALVPGAVAQHGHDDDSKVRHVLLISIDGMHAADYLNCVTANTCPTLKALGNTGVNYTRTTTSRPSD